MKESRIPQTIDKMNLWIGRVVAFVYLAILFFQLMEVILRRVFNSPTIWAWDVNAQLFVGTAMLGGAYVLLRDAHVRMDVLYGRMSGKKRAICDLITFPLATVCLALLNWKVAQMALESWKMKEHSWSLFSPPVYPLKIVFCIAVFLLLLQAISHIFATLRSLRKQTAMGKGEI